jgi:cell division protein FtsI (penicillin-binding protein 3)
MKNIPDLHGMTIRDALAILENKGYKVKYSGFGKVVEYGIIENDVIGLTLH